MVSKVIVGAAAYGFESGGNIVDGGDHDDRDFWIILTQPFEELMPSISGMIMSLSTKSGVVRLT